MTAAVGRRPHGSRTCRLGLPAILAVALFLWRVAVLDGIRPAGSGPMSLRDATIAWLPEAVLVGVGVIAIRRCLDPNDPRPNDHRRAMASAGMLLAWLAVWVPLQLVPGWLVFGPLAADLEPLVANFTLSSVAWIVSVSAAAIVTAIHALPILASVAVGSVAAAILLQRHRPGRRPAFFRCLGLVLSTCMLFWLARSAAAATIAAPLARAAVDAIVVAFLTRRALDRSMRMAGSAPPC